MRRVVEQDGKGAAVLAAGDQLKASAIGGVDAPDLRRQVGLALLGDEIEGGLTQPLGGGITEQLAQRVVDLDEAAFVVDREIAVRGTVDHMTVVALALAQRGLDFQCGGGVAKDRHMQQALAVVHLIDTHLDRQQAAVAAAEVGADHAHLIAQSGVPGAPAGHVGKTGQYLPDVATDHLAARIAKHLDRAVVEVHIDAAGHIGEEHAVADAIEHAAENHVAADLGVTSAGLEQLAAQAGDGVAQELDVASLHGANDFMTRHHAQHASVLDHQEPPHPQFRHQLHRLLQRPRRRDGMHAARHQFGQRCFQALAAAGATHHVAIGQNAHRHAGLGYHHVIAAPPVHQAQGFAQRGAEVQGPDVLRHRRGDGLQLQEILVVEVGEEIRFGYHARHTAFAIHRNQMVHAMLQHVLVRIVIIDRGRQGHHRAAHHVAHGNSRDDRPFGQQCHGVTLGKNAAGAPLCIDYHDATDALLLHAAQHIAQRRRRVAGHYVGSKYRFEKKGVHCSRQLCPKHQEYHQRHIFP